MSVGLLLEEDRAVLKETDHLECLLSRRRDQLASDTRKLREPRLPPNVAPGFSSLWSRFEHSIYFVPLYGLGCLCVTYWK